MSGNYENARLLLTPVEPLERAELFFKMMYELKDGNWVLRKDTDQTRNNFLSGKGPGWLTVDQDDVLIPYNSRRAANNRATNPNKVEIQRFRAISQLQQTANKAAVPVVVLNDNAQKRIREKVTALRAEATAESRAWLNLFDTRFTFTPAGAVPIRAVGTEAMVDTVGVTQKFDRTFRTLFNDLVANGVIIIPATLNSYRPGNELFTIDIVTGRRNMDVDKATARKPWAWNIGQYFVRKAKNEKGPQGTDAWTALIDQPTGPKYEEVISRNGKDLLVKQADGTTKKLTDIAKGTSVCAQSGQTPGTGEVQCQTNIMTCTLSLGDNTTGAATALKSGACRNELLAADVWKIGKDDIKALNPVMIFQLIKNLGFKGVQDKTTGLVTVEDYASWEEKVNDNKLTLDDGSADDLAGELAAAKALAADVNFKNYIIALIGYINSNPAILNGTKAVPKKADDFGVVAALGNEKLESLNSLKEKARESLITVHGSIGAHLTGLKGIMHKNAFALLGIPGMWGGFLSTSVSTRKVDIPKFTDKLREVYEHYVNRLATMNKELSPATKSAVETVLKSLQEKEDKLSLWVEYLYKYSEVMRLENNTDKDNLVGEAQLKDAYEKYENSLAKYHKRSVNMIDILAKLYSAEDSKKEAAGVPLTM